jgi:hypothetical protein
MPRVLSQEKRTRGERPAAILDQSYRTSADLFQGIVCATVEEIRPEPSNLGGGVCAPGVSLCRFATSSVSSICELTLFLTHSTVILMTALLE